MGANAWIFIVLASILGGCIALLADRLGRTLGKKKLRLGGMRPKKTAEVITFAAGVLIPLLTIAIVMVASQDVRRWFAEGTHLLHDRDQLREELSGLQKRRDQLDREQKQAKAQIDSLHAQVKTAQHSVDVAQSEVRKINAQVQSLNARNVSLVSRTESLKAQAAKAGAAVASAQVALTAAKKAFADTLKDLKKSQSQLRIVAEQTNSVSKHNLDVEHENADLDRINRKLKDDALTAKADFQDSMLKNSRSLEEAKLNLDEVSRQLEEENSRLSTAQDNLKFITGLLRTSVANSRYESIIFNVGEELARIPIPAGLKENKAGGYLQSLLHEARVVAESRGATPRNTGLPSAGLFPRGDNGEITTEMQEAAVTKSLADSKEDLVMFATSELNSFRGESVALRIRVFPNKLVYKAGDTVAEVRLNGRNDDEVITNQLYDFFRVRLPDRARRAGMIIPQAQERVFAGVSEGVIARLERLIKGQDQGAKLVAYVTEDTRAGDSLKLEFRIQ